MPISSITLPSVTTPIRSLPVIAGIAADAFPNGNKKVYVSLQRMSDSKYYVVASSAWLAGQTWNDVSTAGGSSSLSPNATSWVFAPLNLDNKFALATTYYVVLSSAVDIAGNVQVGFTAGVSSFTFLYDNQAPSVSISIPVPGHAYKPTAIGQAASLFSGTAADNPVSPPQAGLIPPFPGPGGVQLRLSYVLSGTTYYWNNSAVTFDSSTLTAGTAWFETDDNSWGFGGITSIVWPSAFLHLSLGSRSH